MNRFIISGGGTGGHIFPALAIANQLKKEISDAEILFIGANGKMEMTRIPEAGYNIEGLDMLPIIRDAKFVSHFHQIDPVSEYSPIFDGYIKKVDAEIFIEMRVKGLMGNSTRSNLYIMLSKINYYRTIKKVNAFLYLVLVFRPDDDEQRYIQKNKILQEFEPAITNGLLQIKIIKITQQEYDAIE